MHKYVALLIGAFFVCIVPAAAQPSATGPQEPDDAKYWIFFTDKNSGDGAPAPVEEDYLSERARQRRALRGSSIPAEVDAPVSPSYLALLDRAGVTPLIESRWLNAVSAALSPSEVEAVRAMPFVQELRPVAKLVSTRHAEAVAAGLFMQPPRASVFFEAALDYGPSEKQLANMNAIAPLERGVNGTGVVLGFLDTLFDFDHPAWAQHQAEDRFKEVRDFTQPNQEICGCTQSNYHGLNTSSIAAGYLPGQLVGPGYGATIYAATTEFAPHEINQEEDNFVAGLEWLESQGVDVVNSSLGYTTFDAGQESYSYEDLDGDTGITTRAADRAASLGVVMVVSAGNEGNGSWRYIGTPADGDSVIAVGAVRPDSSRASFTSYGPTADGRIKPDVSALGQTQTRGGVSQGPYVAAQNGGFGYTNGTSFSSPLVAGVVTQLLQVNPELSPVDVRTILRRTASRANQPNNEIGWGIVNADAAVQMAETYDPTSTEELPPVLEFSSVYPSPFTDVLSFTFNAPGNAPRVTVTLYDLLGRAVAGPHTELLSPGPDGITLSTTGLPSGLYVFRLEGQGIAETGAVVLAR